MHRHEGAFRAGARLMDHLGEQFLARAGLAEQQDGRVGSGHGAHLFDGMLQGGGGTDHLAEGKLAVEARLEDRYFLFRRARLQAAFEEQLDLAEVDGLLHEPIGAAAHRLHRGLHVAVSRHHQANRLRRKLQGAVDDRHAVFAGHPKVRQHRVGRHVLHQARGFRGVFGHESLILILQGRAQAFARVLLVVDNQNSRFHGVPDSGRCAAPQTRAAFSVSAVRARATSAKRAWRLAFATEERSSRSHR